MPASPGYSDVRRILVRAPNWVGDLVMATPALRAIRRRFPEAEITLMARGAVAEAAAGVPGIAAVVRYEPRGAHRSFAARRALARDLRARGVDLAVLFPRSFGSALWALGAGARRRLGQRGDWRAWLLTDRLPAVDSRAPRHHVEMFFDLARALGASGEPGPLEYVVGESDAARARELLRQAGDDGGRPRVAIHPGASKPPRGWHLERWEELARRFSLLWDARVLALGAAAEADMAERIAAAAGPQGMSLAGRAPVRVSAALLRDSQFAVLNDSGAMHLAAAVGTPLVAIFGPGSPAVTGPWVDPRRVEVLTHRFPCSPCRQRFFHECDPAPSGKPHCIESVGVGEVWDACCRLRARTLPSGPT